MLPGLTSSDTHFPGCCFSVSFLLFLERGLKLPTIAVYYAALKDPLFYDFHLTLDPRLLKLIR